MKLFSVPEYVLASLSVCGGCFMQSGMWQAITQVDKASGSQNVAGAFHCTPAFATGTLCGRRIVIIDDVCTTGATIEACAMPLFAAGATMVWGLVLARPVA